MAKLYGNENFPLPAVESLRALGHDVTTVMETGRAEQSWPDHEVLAFAHAQGRAPLTINRKHFIRLHNAGQPHSGIIACTLDLDFAGQAKRIHEAVGNVSSLAGHVLRINRPLA